MVKLGCCSMPRAVKVALLLVASVSLVILMAATYISTSALEFGRQIRLFKFYNTTLAWSQRSKFQSISIMPAGWAFSIWGLIYAYQVLLLAYCWTLPFRKAYSDGQYLCTKPDLLPGCLLLWHCVSSWCNFGWIIVADQIEYNTPMLIPMTILLFSITISLYIAVAISYWSLWREKARIVSCGKRTDHWLIVGLVQNGISLYASWVTFASFINVAMSLLYYAGIEETVSTVSSLCGVMALALAYAIADLTVLDLVTRYVFTPHLVVMWACAGLLQKQFIAWSALSITAIVLASTVGCALVLKLVLICARSRSKPILSDGEFKLEGKLEK